MHKWGVTEVGPLTQDATATVAQTAAAPQLQMVTPVSKTLGHTLG